MAEGFVNVVSHDPGTRLVVVENLAVRVFRVEHVEDNRFAVIESFGAASTGNTIHLGSREECGKVLDSLRQSLDVAVPADRSPYRTLALIGISVFACTAALTFSAEYYVRSHGVEAPRQAIVAPMLAPKPADLAIAQPKAPEVIAGSEPAGEEESAKIGGNDQSPGSVSPHGATGAGILKGQRPNVNTPDSHPPDLAKMPPLPVPVAKPKPVTSSDVASLATAPPTQSAPKPVIPAAQPPILASSPAPSVPASASTINPANPTAHPAGEAAIDPSKGLPDVIAQRAKDAQVSIDEAKAKALADISKDGPKATKETLDKMQAAYDTVMNGEKLSAEVARGLPVDLAKALQEAGAIETPEEEAHRLAKDTGKEGLALLRLPPDVTDKFRDEDGVQTVPDANSWALTRNNVTLPLPGGGEIKKPSDLALFGLDM